MNFLYHTSLGVIGTIITDDPMFLVGSIIPDITMMFNEIIIRKNKQEFDENKVKPWILNSYRFLHSLVILPLIWLLGINFFIGYVIHQVTDWFTHVGRFATMPFYPLNKYQFKFGKNILK